MNPPASTLLAIDGLTVEFTTAERKVVAVRDLTLSVDRGETVAVVGESGSGKSVTALSVMRLVEHGGGRITAGSIRFQRPDHGAIDIVGASARTMREIRGGEIAMIFQEPMTSLNPVFPVGDQIAEAIALHQGKDAAGARAEALRMLEQVRMPEARQVLGRYPHQLSGGMRQRVMIAMALSCKPALLIADEPTTALDVTIQAQILALIRVLQAEMHMAVLFITHDMGVVAEVADRVAVMLRGEKVEEGSADEIFARPQQPYTRNLIAAVPRLGALQGEDAPRKIALPGTDAEAPVALPHGSQPLLRVRDLSTRFDVKAGFLSRVTRRVHAVENVSFDLAAGETLALVGESGCGKSTTGRSLLRLVEPERGSIEFEGRDIARLSRPAMQEVRRDIQMIFQDPFASLDPRLTVGFSIAEPLHIHGVARGREAEERVARAARARGPGSRARAAVSARVLRRPAPAHRDRARARAAAEGHRRRRAGVGARRLDPGADREPAASTSSASSISRISSSRTTWRWSSASAIAWR